MLTETTSSVRALPPMESATMECRNTSDILNVEADVRSLGKIIFFGSLLVLNRL